ncbi:MAG: hypothetical protein ACRD8U_14705 [Pyrinomonadaceae bacterium]
MRFIPPISSLSPRVQVAFAVVPALCLVTLFFPFKTTIVPEWRLRVVDQAGAPVPGINVTEHWQHFLLESVGHEELRQTGIDGTVSFSGRTIRASLLRRLLATLSSLATEGFRAKRRPGASVVIWGSKDHATTVETYDDEQAPLSEIVVHSFK